MTWSEWIAKLLKKKPKPNPTPTPVDPITLQALLDAHNSIRLARNLPTLKLDTRLVQAAQSHSDDMSQRDKLSHNGSDRSNIGTRLVRVGYPYRSAGENIAMGQTDVGSVMSSWMSSSGHRANILNPTFRDFGGGFAKSINGTYYWTAVFGATQ